MRYEIYDSVKYKFFIRFISFFFKKKTKKEIKIHKSLNNPNIVKFHESFEDTNFFYIVIELCNSMVRRMHKKNVTYYCYRHNNFNITNNHSS